MNKERPQGGLRSAVAKVLLAPLAIPFALLWRSTPDDKDEDE